MHPWMHGGVTVLEAARTGCTLGCLRPSPSWTSSWKPPWLSQHPSPLSYTHSACPAETVPASFSRCASPCKGDRCHNYSCILSSNLRVANRFNKKEFVFILVAMSWKIPKDCCSSLVLFQNGAQPARAVNSAVRQRSDFTLLAKWVKLLLWQFLSNKHHHWVRDNSESKL